jgi:hypothetical protein
VQDAIATADWRQRVVAGSLPAVRGHALSAEDRLRARAIEMLLCGFRLDLGALGDDAAALCPTVAAVARRFGDLVEADDGGFAIRPAGVPIARIVASVFDGYLATGGRFRPPHSAARSAVGCVEGEASEVAAARSVSDPNLSTVEYLSDQWFAWSCLRANRSSHRPLYATARESAHCDQRLERASTSRSRSAWECRGEGVKRRRSVPLGTVG